MSLFKSLVGVFALFLVTTTPVLAKDLSGRVGIGFINEFSNKVPALSVKYAMSKDIHWLAAFGVDTKSPTKTVAAGKFFKNIFYETNLNFYGTLGFAYLKDGTSGFEILAALGAEFFIPGIDSLGLSFEAGLSAGNSRDDSFSVSTIGYTFLNAGMHFYF